MKARGKKSLLERAVVVERRLRQVRGLNNIEETFNALGLAATPEERWDINRFWLDRLPPVAVKAMRAEALQPNENGLDK
jgi:hypothetical protein